MIIENLKIEGLRNLKGREFSFCESKNLIHGENGTGKTTVLEAIFIPAFGKSFLNIKKSELVSYGEDKFFLDLTCKTLHGANKIGAYFSNKKFSLLLNNKNTTLVEINRYLHPVVFSSANYNQYIESKPYARKMIDRFIFGVDSLYIHYILSYNKALKQKNQLLKTRGNVTELRSWNRIMSETAEKIVDKRATFITRLNAEIKKKYAGSLKIEYKPSLGTKIGKEAIFLELEKMKEIEARCKRCLKGTHLDDFSIHLNSRNLKFHSSGEKKINLLMVYISFIELFNNIHNDYPIFLIDDYDTAIDERNIAFLIDHYPDLQVIATSVNKNSGFDQLIELKKEN